MKKNKNTKKKWAILSIMLMGVMLLPSILAVCVSAKKGVGFTVSPMKEVITLNPGDEYSSTLEIHIPSEYENDMKYSVDVAPFFVDENYTNDFNNTYGTNNEMVKWITIESPKEGRLSPGEKTTVEYKITVPKDAAGGGQYASILVGADVWSDEDKKGDDSGNKDGDVDTAVKEEKKIAHTIYAEVTGNVIRQGEITEANVPSFLLSGNITGTSSIKNTGNVHGTAKYTLQVFPLFSSEEIYTNEENPDERTILPDRTLYNETAWSGTPGIGMFNVIYTVDFEGVTTQVSKMVIICPIWLLFLVIFAIAALIIWIILKIRSHGNKSRRTTETSSNE